MAYIINIASVTRYCFVW